MQGWRGTALVVGAVLLTLLPHLAHPFGRDQGNYAYPAWAWLQGLMPYRDVFVFKPPGTVWVHALAILGFGATPVAIRELDLLWTLATALSLRAVLSRVSTPGVAVGAAALYPYLYGVQSHWSSCQTDAWMNLPCALVLLLSAQAAEQEGLGRAWRLVAAGLALAFTFWLKYTGAAIVLPLLLLLARDPRPVRAAGWGALGLALGLGAGALWLVQGGAWDPFVESQLALVPYVDETGRTKGILSLLGQLWRYFYERDSMLPMLVAFGLGLIPAGLRLRSREGRFEVVFGAAWLFAGLASLVAQDKFFKYHGLMALPGAAIFGGWALAAIAARAGRFAALPLLAIAVGAFAASPYTSTWPQALEVATGRISLKDHWIRGSFGTKDMSVRDNTVMAEWLRRNTREGDRVYIWGFEPGINFEAGRLSVSRFLYNYPFAVSWGNPAYEAELLAALRETPPELFVVSSKDAVPHATGNKLDSRELFQQFTALRSFVEEGYRFERRVRRFDVYRRGASKAQTR